MQLTNQERARVFAMYYGCKYQIEIEGQADCLINDSYAIQCREREPSISTNAKLLLTPLSKISDEDAIEVAKVVTRYSGKAIAMRYKNSSGAISVILSDRHDKGSPYTRLDIFKDLSMQWIGKDLEEVDYFNLPFVHQYLISQGYAVPLFFALNHWANNKTAIELEIAIDKTLN